MKKSICLLISCALVATVAACSRKEPSAPPVATPTISLDKDKAAIGSPLRITYKFAVAPGAAIDDDYLVFMHVIGPDNETLWQDDHAPAIPTRQWKPGQTVEYTRTIFVPNYPFVGDATLRVGLYNQKTGARLPLSGTEAGRHEYQAGKLSLLPQNENVFLIYKEGWHGAEVDPGNPLNEWQWTKKAAAVSFKNPKRDATFYLEFEARPDLFNPPQQVTVKLAGQPIGTFTADSRERTLKTFPVTAAQFDDGDIADLVIEVDRTFTGTGDSRELGIRVFHMFIEPK